MAGGREGLPSSSSFPGTWVRSNPALIWLVWICALLLGWHQAQPITCQHPDNDKCFPRADSEKQHRQRQDPQPGPTGQGWAAVDGRHSLSPASTPAPKSQVLRPGAALCLQEPCCSTQPHWEWRAQTSSGFRPLHCRRNTLRSFFSGENFRPLSARGFARDMEGSWGEAVGSGICGVKRGWTCTQQMSGTVWHGVELGCDFGRERGQAQQNPRPESEC